MKLKYYKVFIMVLLIAIATLTSCSNSKTVVQEEPNDIDVSIKYKIVLDDKLKTVNPDIIKATRQALFDDECVNSKFMHFNGYSVNREIIIYDIKEKSADVWEVYYDELISGERRNKDKNVVTYATIQKYAAGAGGYHGQLLLGGGSSNMKYGETY